MSIAAYFSSPRASFWATAALLLAGGWGAQFAAGGLADLRAALLSGAAVFAGCAALGWLRPARVGITAPQVMMLLGALGMLAGLALDVRSAGLDVLASMCLTAASLDLLSLAQLHWDWLPAMHVGMVAGGFLAVPLLRYGRRNCRRQLCARLTQNLACSAWMILGMSAGTMVAHRLAALGGGLDAADMLGGMFGGMVWGMVASVALYRTFFHWRDLREPRRG